MLYLLKNGENVLLRPPRVEDAERLVEVMSQADGESPFLAREPGEFDYTAESEAKVVQEVLSNPDEAWFLPEYRGRVVGQCSARLVGRRSRFRHRAMVGFVLLKECWGLGIGGKMMEECLAWCREKGALQAELEVVEGNERALAMYRGFGFEATGRVPRGIRYADGSFADLIKMVKTL